MEVSSISNATQVIPRSCAANPPSSTQKQVDCLISVRVETEEKCGRLYKCMDRIIECISKIFLGIWYWIKSWFCSDPPYRLPSLKMDLLFSEEEIKTMRKNFSDLGESNWKIVIDGDRHKYGKYVFDRGLHGGSIEPGYIVSMERNAFPLISQYLGTRTTSSFFLELHRAACWHFKGNYTDTLMSNERIGAFRNEKNIICCSYGTAGTTEDDWREFLEFKPSLGRLSYTSNEKTRCKMNYKTMSANEIEAHLKTFLDDFYNEQRKATTKREKIRAIAFLAKKMDWLHPPHDGSTRTCLLIMQKHLTEYVGHPAIFEDPHMMTKMGLEKFTTYVEEALNRWEKERSDNPR